MRVAQGPSPGSQMNKPYGFCPDHRQAACLLSSMWSMDTPVSFASVDEVSAIYVAYHRDLLLLLGLDERKYQKALREELLQILLAE